MIYRLTEDGETNIISAKFYDWGDHQNIQVTTDQGTFGVPIDEGNADYQLYLLWCEQNDTVAEPADNIE